METMRFVMIDSHVRCAAVSSAWMSSVVKQSKEGAAERGVIIILSMERAPFPFGCIWSKQIFQIIMRLDHRMDDVPDAGLVRSVTVLFVIAKRFVKALSLPPLDDVPEKELIVVHVGKQRASLRLRQSAITKKLHIH